MLIAFTVIQASSSIYLACGTIVLGALIASLQWSDLLQKVSALKSGFNTN